jgi:hypothetical protein
MRLREERCLLSGTNGVGAGKKNRRKNLAATTKLYKKPAKKVK